jgi:hypothetical protein
VNPVEDALIERIDARRAFATALGKQSERNRSILIDRWRSGCTFREIGIRHGVSCERVRQICTRGFRDVDRALRQPALAPTLARPPPGFDKAAFLDHMRGVILRKKEAEEYAERCRKEAEEYASTHIFKMDVAAMDRFMELATPPKPKPPPDPEILAARLRSEEARRQYDEANQRLREIMERQTLARERADWIRALQEAIAACDGTHYAPLIPQMMDDIAKINAEPAGALPWRFDRATFDRHFAQFKAQVDAGTYRSV